METPLSLNCTPVQMTVDPPQSSLPNMGNSGSSEFRRRYAYPGELSPDVGEQKPTAPALESATLEPKPSAPVSKSATYEPKSAVLAPKPANLQPRAGVLAPKPGILETTPAVPAPKPGTFQPKPSVPAPRPANLPPRLAVPASKPGTFDTKLSIPVPKPASVSARPAALPSKPAMPGPRPTEVRLGLGFSTNRKPVASSAWKDTIGTKRVAARFQLLPDPKPRWDRISLSAGGQLAFLAFLLLLPQIFPQEMQTALKFNVVEVMQPVTEFPAAAPEPPPPPPPPKVKPKVRPPEPKPVELEPKPVVPEPIPVTLNPRQPHVFMVVKPEARSARTVEAKPVELNPAIELVKIEMPTSEPKRPKDDVNVGTLGPGAAATLVAAANKVQTGGFGDPNGIPGHGNPNRAGNINQAGSPLLPGGPGYGNGTGGAKGLRGTIAEGPKKSSSAGGGGNSPVSILSRPNPVYSTEGRALRIEGDVVLEVIFLASGQVKVNGIVSGLGHGLDEAAIQAATQIRFKPAIQNGRPVDFPARVRISFRVAS